MYSILAKTENTLEKTNLIYYSLRATQPPYERNQPKKNKNSSWIDDESTCAVDRDWDREVNQSEYVHSSDFSLLAIAILLNSTNSLSNFRW